MMISANQFKEAVMTKKNLFYAQSGGPTAVINTTACAVIQTAKQYPNEIGTVFAGQNGIMGALNEELIDTYAETDQNIEALQYMPASAFGSCRFKLKSLTEDEHYYRRLIEVFAAHDIGYFFYNGGGDSQDTTYKISQMSEQMGYPLICLGLPKTIDNDLAFTDCCPGFGSTAKYIATSIREASMDVAAMAKTSTKVFVMEVMGRHAGWIAAAGGLAQRDANYAPQIILFPEIPFAADRFYAKLKRTVETCGYCSIVVSEGIKNPAGQFMSDSGAVDAFGHHQLGGVAPIISQLIKQSLGYKCHWAVSDYLQRCARHIASDTDAKHAYAIGKTAVEYAIGGKNNIMVTIERQSTTPYQWTVGEAPIAEVANKEKKMPREFISEDGFGITASARAYLQPLIQGEAFPPFENGLPKYPQLKKVLATKKCPETCSV